MRASPLYFDRREATRYLDALGSCDEEQFTFQTLDDDQTRKDRRLNRLLTGRLEEVADTLERLNQRGAGVYVTVNKIRPGPRTAANVIAVRAVFVDLDDAPLDPVWLYELPPHIIVESSPGKYHVYWRAHRSVELGYFKTLQRKLANVFDGDPSVCDLPRILRLPGAWHQKVRPDGRRSEPFMTRIIHPSKEGGHVEW
jgi:putative DNA primase/helicase